MSRRKQVLSSLLAATSLLALGTVGVAQTPNWSGLAKDFPALAQLLVRVTSMRYQLAFDRAIYREMPIYLVAAIPAQQTATTSAADDFSTERPASAVVTSVRYQNPFALYPIESVLVLATMSSSSTPSTLSFRCVLFIGSGVTRTPCQGSFNIPSGNLEFKLNELLVERTEQALRQPTNACVADVYKAERSQKECAGRQLGLNLGCSIVAHLYAAHECRVRAGLTRGRG